MSLIKNTRLFFRNYFLKDKLKSKKKSTDQNATSFEKAGQVGILFNATNLDVRQTVLKYAKSLKEQNKKVLLLGYFDNALNNENFTFKHYNSKNIDWALRPGGQDVTNFLQQKFDILISLETESSLHIEYIAALSNASLKVGPFTEHTYCYDLMIDTSNKSDLSKFIKEVERLLKKTNNRHEPANI